MDDCDRADMIVSVIPIRGRCAHPTATIDRFDVWRHGAHAVWIDAAGGFRIESVAASLGDRPWVLDRMRGSLRPRRDSPQDDSAAEDDQAVSNRPSESTEAADE